MPDWANVAVLVPLGFFVTVSIIVAVVSFRKTRERAASATRICGCAKWNMSVG